MDVTCIYILATGINLEEYREKFTEDDVEDSFLYMLSKLEKELKFTDTLREMFDLLSNSPFCNWLEIRILKSMADVAGILEATSILKIFEECTS